MEKERKKEETGPICFPFGHTVFTYKRIVILIKARIILPCEVIATISLDAFSTSVINASRDSSEDDTNERFESVKESVSGEISAEINRDSINEAT